MMAVEAVCVCRMLADWKVKRTLWERRPHLMENLGFPFLRMNEGSDGTGGEVL